MTFRPLADNVLIVLEPEITETRSGIAMVRQRSAGARFSRTARVLESGKGYHGRPSYLHPEGFFHPNTLKPGDRILVDALAGNNWDMDVSAPRNNGADTRIPERQGLRLTGEKSEVRVIREAEALAILEDGVEVSNDAPTPTGPRHVDLS